MSLFIFIGQHLQHFSSMRNIYDELVVACVKIGEEFSGRWILQHPENGNCVTINKILSNKNGHSIVVAQVLGNDSDYGGAKDFGGDRVTKVGKVYTVQG